MKFSLYSNSVSFARRRTGITVLEVLISIGVVAVGLLGVAALIPAAGHHARKGLEADYRSQVGQAAFRDFRIRGLGDAMTETAAGGMTQYYAKALVTSAGQPVQFLPNASYCIDPISVAWGKTEAVGPLARVSVRSTPARTTADIKGGGTIMDKVQAESAFTAWDDLVRQDPEKNDDKAIVQAGQEECGGRRQAMGDYSWMATLVPEPDSGDLYTLSAVVLHRRNCKVDPPADDPLQATLGTVTMLSGGLGGGDVQITGLGEAVGSRMKPGTWILLTNGSNYHRWYQIIATEAIDEKKPIPEFFTLRGPDWLGGTTVSGVYVKGAVAVYEKTIRLVSPSQWDVVN